MSEKIIIVLPFAYVNVFDDVDSIQTENRMYDGRKLFWRIYWVGFGHKV